MRGGRSLRTTAEWTRERITVATMIVAPPVAVILIEFFVSVTLVSTVPFWLYAIAALCGAAYGNVILGYMPNRAEAVTAKLGWEKIFIIGFYAIGIAPYFLRQILLIGAFAFTNVTTVNELYAINGASGGRSKQGIYLKPLKEGRTIKVFASSDMVGIYGHVSTFGRDCVRLETETGRGGFRRARTPSIFDAEFNDNFFSTASVVADCKASDSLD